MECERSGMRLHATRENRGHSLIFEGVRSKSTHRVSLSMDPRHAGSANQNARRKSAREIGQTLPSSKEEREHVLISPDGEQFNSVDEYRAHVMSKLLSRGHTSNEGQ